MPLSLRKTAPEEDVCFKMCHCEASLDLLLLGVFKPHRSQPRLHRRLRSQAPAMQVLRGQPQILRFQAFKLVPGLCPKSRITRRRLGLRHLSCLGGTPWPVWSSRAAPRHLGCPRPAPPSSRNERDCRSHPARATWGCRSACQPYPLS